MEADASRADIGSWIGVCLFVKLVEKAMPAQ